METYVLLNCDPGHEVEIIATLKKLREVMEINGVWGKYDIFVKVNHSDPTDLDKFIHKLRAIKNITSTYTMPVLYGQGGSIDDIS